ncbi:MAG: DNA repair protein RadC [Woeseia sp.]|nr:DNA repair protein RadC [Woeseia sp.]MBT8097258.1 DNA repair protein RadC [Woeseia sp.]NNE59785.1 DNA repair protein RadC [Woeseia sp.]NNL54682.1 DNA repair protein RadC [Woeseia sp.]
MHKRQSNAWLSPRHRLVKGGASGLSDAELLTAVLQLGSPYEVASGLSARLLNRFGSLRALLSADVPALQREPGVGAARSALLSAIPDLARRYYEQSLPVGEAIRSPTDTEAFLTAKLRDLPHEIFCCLYLDNRHRVLRFETLFRGTIDGTSVYPREVVKQALAANAAAIILAHNHPSGVAEPSQADERITRRLKAALDLVDIRLLDHLVVGDGSCTSLASRGLL